MTVMYFKDVITFVTRAFSYGYNTLVTLLDSTGIDHKIYFAAIIGFAVVSLVLTTIMQEFRGSADTSLKSMKNKKKTEGGKE